MRLTIVAILSGALAGWAQSPAEKPVLTLCRLLENVEQYHRQTVLVRAVFAVGFETATLTDTECRDKGPTDVEFSKSMKKAPRSLEC